MFPSKSDYKNLALLELIKLDTAKYYDKLNDYYEEKKMLFKVSIILDIPIVFVLALFSTIHFNNPWWAFFLYFFSIALISFFVVCIPVYYSISKSIKEKEQHLFQEVDQELSTLAQENFFSNESKAKRLLNQEFELVKLQPLSSKNINLILDNLSLATQTIDMYDKSTAEIKKSITVFYEQQPLKPIALATVNFLGKDKTFSVQAKIPIEYELVNGLVSEQLIYFEKDNYYVNPTVYIDRFHFNDLYQAN